MRSVYTQIEDYLELQGKLVVLGMDIKLVNENFEIAICGNDQAIWFRSDNFYDLVYWLDGYERGSGKNSGSVFSKESPEVFKKGTDGL